MKRKKKYEYFFIFFTLLVDNMKIYSYTIDCKTKKQDKRENCEILLNMEFLWVFFESCSNDILKLACF